MAKLVLIRHGQSLWNLHNLFTGWVDVPLSAQGVQEAIAAGKRLSHEKFDIIYTSTLIRAITTAMIVMSENLEGKVPILQKENAEKPGDWFKIYSPASEANSIPVYSAWQLNERMYGELQGMNKEETAKKFGDAQVKIWRRSYDVPPPQGESLKDTAARSIPWFEKNIEPKLKEGKNILVAAHGNSLRSIIMHLEKLTEAQVLELELKTGEPVVFNAERGTIVRSAG
ncbi:2,3-bisphosphoglycerate-dependent phosphoglycerate mutase [Turneriella parva]|uniref:2,3-bisphosphoglycerate-dependent phosphoglycerate mutase n=1 Tax=Turneriella parva (strain ATCC BAA-1111 / DSM 21527 / NCTC 11395 / H) TaxID=869212 RepID=I4B6J0_TURPD|nr:2,3-bisphosphoglycerate-dependent phosphoglycerate mutase [Turneriella parva]AFM12897.1 phosphoglycerate mutase [Turneriella parva DSM 21527]